MPPKQHAQRKEKSLEGHLPPIVDWFPRGIVTSSTTPRGGPSIPGRLLESPSNGYPAEFSWCNKAEPKWAQKTWPVKFIQCKSPTSTMVYGVFNMKGGTPKGRGPLPKQMGLVVVQGSLWYQHIRCVYLNNSIYLSIYLNMYTHTYIYIYIDIHIQ